MIEVPVHLAALLWSYSGGRKEVRACGATVGEVLADLERQFPGIRFRVVDEQDRLRPHVRLFVNQDDCRDLAAKLAAGDEVHVIGALSGG